MKTVHQHIRENILKNLGMGERKKMPNLEELKISEWSPKFEQLMRNRLIMGSIRYGQLNAPNKPQYDRIPSMIHRLELYQKDRNAEHLVDVANICLMEFEEGDNHFTALDECKEKGHVKEIT